MMFHKVTGTVEKTIRTVKFLDKLHKVLYSIKAHEIKIYSKYFTLLSSFIIYNHNHFTSQLLNDNNIKQAIYFKRFNNPISIILFKKNIYANKFPLHYIYIWKKKFTHNPATRIAYNSLNRA